MRKNSCLSTGFDRKLLISAADLLLCPLLTDTVIRLSLFHHEHPFNMNVNGQDFGVGYWPGDSRSGMFGG